MFVLAIVNDKKWWAVNCGKFFDKNEAEYSRCILQRNFLAELHVIEKIQDKQLTNVPFRWYISVDDEPYNSKTDTGDA